MVPETRSKASEATSGGQGAARVTGFQGQGGIRLRDHLEKIPQILDHPRGGVVQLRSEVLVAACGRIHEFRDVGEGVGELVVFEKLIPFRLGQFETERSTRQTCQQESRLRFPGPTSPASKNQRA